MKGARLLLLAAVPVVATASVGVLGAGVAAAVGMDPATPSAPVAAPDVVVLPAFASAPEPRDDLRPTVAATPNDEAWSERSS